MYTVFKQPLFDGWLTFMVGWRDLCKHSNASKAWAARVKPAADSIGPHLAPYSWSTIAYLRPLLRPHNMQPLQRAALRSARGVRSQIQRRHASHGAGDAHHSSGNESFGVR